MIVVLTHKQPPENNMRRLTHSGTDTFIVIGYISMSSSAKKTTKKPTKTNLLAEYFDTSTKMYPSFRAFLGDRSLDHTYENTLSRAHLIKHKQLINHYHALLEKAKRGQHDIDTSMLEWIIRDNLEGMKQPFDLIPIDSYDNGIIDFTFFNKQMYPLETEQHVENLILRHVDYIDVIHTMMQKMRRGMKTGIVLPTLICTRLIESLRKFIHTKGYIIQLPKPLAELQEKLDAFMLQKYAPVLRSFLKFVREEYLHTCRDTVGMCHLPGGKRMYRYSVRSMTTLDDMTPEEAHQLGLLEIKRLLHEVHTVKIQLGHPGEMPLQEFYKSMMTNKKYRYASEEHVLKDYKKTVAKINHTVMAKNFKNNVADHVIKRVPKAMEATAPGAFYWPPSSVNRERPGIFYLNLRDIKEHLTYTTLALSLHEGKPGHHLQFQYLVEKKVPLHRVYGISGTAFVEGWGLYAESLGDYRGKPEDYFGKLTYEMFRAARLVVDTGIHYYGWTYDQAVKFMKDHVAMTETEIKTEVERYICMPAQALCYKIGEVRLQSWRRQWEVHFGSSERSIKNFHECVLESGVIPLDVLGQKLQQCMKQGVGRKAEGV
jgi:uncharacterized protein (DUF885 family)